MVEIEEHPLLAAAVLAHELPVPLADLEGGDAPDTPFERSEEVRAAVRRLLRHGGYRPTGRGKPASEYLVRAAEEGGLPVVNPVVDALNAISLASGLPMSVVDLDRLKAPFKIGLAPEGSSYVFNRSGQEIRLDGLLCLFDSEGPCANAVKDAQHAKTGDGTRRCLCVVWGSTEVGADRTEAVAASYDRALTALGAATIPVP